VPDHFDTPKQMLDFGVYQLWDATKAVDELVSVATQIPQIRDFHFWAQFPGEPVESGSVRAQYIAEHVIPEVTQRLSRQPANV
jgi:hypothetical protein